MAQSLPGSDSSPSTRASQPLCGRVAIVTGANHGIGAATARRLAMLGADVLITYLRRTGDLADGESREYVEQRSRDGADVVAAIEALDRRAVAVEADLTDPRTVPRLFDRAEADLGPVDILINNASGWGEDTFDVDAVRSGAGSAVTPDTIDLLVGVDMRAPALMISGFARRLAERTGDWGRIVGMTSGGPSGFPGQVSYGAAKAAQENYTKAAATELAPLGVTANVVHPPVTDTGWVDEGVRAFVASSRDLVHVATPDEVAVVIGWLCTDDAALVSGNVIRLR